MQKKALWQGAEHAQPHLVQQAVQETPALVVAVACVIIIIIRVGIGVAGRRRHGRLYGATRGCGGRACCGRGQICGCVCGSGGACGGTARLRLRR